MRGDRVGEHRLEHELAVSRDRRLHGPLLHDVDAAQELAHDPGDGRLVAATHTGVVGDAHDLDDRVVVEIRHVAVVRQVDRKTLRLAGDHAVEQLRDELTRGHARDVGGVAHLLEELDVFGRVTPVARHAVVVDAPFAAVVVRRLHEAGHELDRVMVARPDEHTEAPEQLEAHPVVLDHVELGPVVGRRDLDPARLVGRVHPDRLGRGAFGVAEERVQPDERVVVAFDLQRGGERVVVDAAEDRIDLVHAAVEQQAEDPRATDPLVAETDGLDVGLARHRPAQRGQRIGDVHEPRVGRDRFDVARDVEQHRDAAQGAQDAAGTDAVADRLPDAVALRDLDVVLHRVESTDGERGDHEIGAGERAAAVTLRLHPEIDAATPGDLRAEVLHQHHAPGVEIVQDDVARRSTTVCWRSRRAAVAPSGSSHRRQP